MVCKTCERNLPKSQFSKIKRPNSVTLRHSCKECEYDKALERKFKRAPIRKEEPRIAPTRPNDGPGVDVNKLMNDPEGAMPSDSDMLFWSTPFFDLIVDSRDILINEEPKDD